MIEEGESCRPCGLNYNAWAKELTDDIDKEFILNGVSGGFDNVYINAVPHKAEQNNHASMQSSSNFYSKGCLKIKDEMELKNYVKVSKKTVVISSLGALPKSDGDVRLIHDCSRPEGGALNDYATDS